MNKTALITGINGQDGFYLSKFLAEKNYSILGIGTKDPKLKNVKSILADITNKEMLHDIIKKTKPNEIYNLAAKSKPAESWNENTKSIEVNSIAPINIFEVCQKINPMCKVFQASSAEIFGGITTDVISETSPFKPSNPYGAAKLYAHNMAEIYRNSFKQFISSGILFNHESPKRGMHFISQKITYAAACLKAGIKTSKQLNEKAEPILKNRQIALGNLDARRDFGFAGDYVAAMWLMLQQAKPDDFIIATGNTKSIRDLCKIAFSYVDLNYEDHITVDKDFFRPIETKISTADPRKAKEILGWQAKTSFEELITNMIDHHLKTTIPNEDRVILCN